MTHNSQPRTYNRQLLVRPIRSHEGSWRVPTSYVVVSRRSLVATGHGFTLVELLVSMMLFVVIVSIVSMIFVTSIRAQKNITALIVANDNTFLALEQMAREMRVGTAFNLSSPSEIDFTNAQGESVGYCYVDAAIKRAVTNLTLPCSGSNWKKVTADNVNIASLKIIASGMGQNDGAPTRITLVLSVGAKGSPNIEGIFTHIQTTITVRNLDN